MSARQSTKGTPTNGYHHTPSNIRYGKKGTPTSSKSNQAKHSHPVVRLSDVAGLDHVIEPLLQTLRRLSKYKPVKEATPEPRRDSTSSRKSCNSTPDLTSDLSKLKLNEDPASNFSHIRKKKTGMLLYGFTGTGKTLAIDAIIHELSSKDNLKCMKIDGACFIQDTAEKEVTAKLREIFDEAVEHSPSIIFLDRLDRLFRFKKSPTYTENQITSCLLTFFDKISSDQTDSHVMIVGVTNDIEAVDPVLRGPDKFEAEIEFPVPIAKNRKLILSSLLSKYEHDLAQEAIDAIAETSFSYTGADLKLSVITAYEVAEEQAVSGPSDKEVVISEGDLKKGIELTKPSAMKEISLEVPCVRWAEIGGVKDIRKKLEQMVIWPFKYAHLFDANGITRRKGILMYGPPGCSKTMIGKALATESNLNFISIKGPEVFSKYVGESEKSVRELFRKAKQAAPSILFFDEIDALASSRGTTTGNSGVGDRVVNTLLLEMDGIESLGDVVVIAATNRPDIIDPALKRPGRFDSEIYVPLPDAETRREIFDIRLKKMPVDFTDISLKELSDLTEGYSGAEASEVCQAAGHAALAEVIDSGKEMKVKKEHFVAALLEVKPQTSESTIKFFRDYHNRKPDYNK